jgi:hypothetical protein
MEDTFMRDECRGRANTDMDQSSAEGRGFITTRLAASVDLEPLERHMRVTPDCQMFDREDV